MSATSEPEDVESPTCYPHYAPCASQIDLQITDEHARWPAGEGFGRSEYRPRARTARGRMTGGKLREPRPNSHCGPKRHSPTAGSSPDRIRSCGRDAGTDETQPDIIDPEAGHDRQPAARADHSHEPFRLLGRHVQMRHRLGAVTKPSAFRSGWRNGSQSATSWLAWTPASRRDCSCSRALVVPTPLGEQRVPPASIVGGSRYRPFGYRDAGNAPYSASRNGSWADREPDRSRIAYSLALRPRGTVSIRRWHTRPEVRGELIANSCRKGACCHATPCGAAAVRAR